MQLPSASSWLLAAACAVATLPGVSAAAVAAEAPSAPPAESTKSSKPTKTVLPCTASSTSGAFYDLRPDIAVAVAKGTKPKSGVRVDDYKARGYDYGSNFTINICSSVVEPVTDVVGVDKNLWANVSAYYQKNDYIFSLGSETSILKSRGRELVLQYTGGSPCPDPSTSKPSKDVDLDTRDFYAPEHKSSSSSSTSSSTSDDKSSTPIRRKSATFAFLCTHDPLDSEAHISFIGTPDECSYFFKVRSQHACAGAEPHKPGSVGPGGVFAIIFGVALLVYCIGGVVYQRTVAHARGWRQLPNYTLWAGIWGFFRDFFIILASSCVRLLPRHRGYHTVSSSPSGRNHSRDAENRLIDQLDEEWED